MPAKITYPPNEPMPTLGELRAGEVSVYVRCLSCFNPKWIKPADIRGDDSRTLADVAVRARCSNCGSAERAEVSVIPEHWVRYLRSIGQHDRLPEDSNSRFPPGQPQGWP